MAFDFKFQSTLPARGATDELDEAGEVVDISIHAPREGSDCPRRRKFVQQRVFQSTLPARGATSVKTLRGVICGVISIHAPREGSDDAYDTLACVGNLFQSTLPARGATLPYDGGVFHYLRFQSTLPARGATRMPCQSQSPRWNFNPRSPRGERRTSPGRTPKSRYFNPRSPRGERPLVPAGHRCAQQFQSTLPARGATNVLRRSIRFYDDFNPRSPRGERRKKQIYC